MTFEKLSIIIEPDTLINGKFRWALDDPDVKYYIASGFAATPEAAGMAGLEAMKQYLECEVDE